MPPETREKADKADKPDPAGPGPTPAAGAAGGTTPPPPSVLAEAAREEKKPEKAKVEYATPSGKASGPSGPGFFSVYKKGQGYWTRMGTAIALLALGGLTAYNLYYYAPRFGLAAGPGRIYLGAGFFVLFAVLMWRLINKPSNVDFLIATDSEMKKVNWTSRRELLGSTKVVIFFMILIAVLLFIVDIIFGYIMYLIGVLHGNPFKSGTLGGG